MQDWSRSDVDWFNLLSRKKGRDIFFHSAEQPSEQLGKWRVSCHSPYVKEPASSNNKQKESCFSYRNEDETSLFPVWSRRPNLCRFSTILPSFCRFPKKWARMHSPAFIYAVLSCQHSVLHVEACSHRSLCHWPHISQQFQSLPAPLNDLFIYQKASLQQGIQL